MPDECNELRVQFVQMIDGEQEIAELGHLTQSLLELRKCVDAKLEELLSGRLPSDSRTQRRATLSGTFDISFLL